MRFTLVISLFFLAAYCRAQRQAGYTVFTVRDGLPSNYIYRCVEDNKGFLWVATDAGLARFDGRHFQVFTTKDGLPDNEVLEVIKENDGRIWVNCFKQSPACFDEEKNKFFDLTEDSTLSKVIRSTTMTSMFPLNSGGIMYNNQNGSFVLKNKKLVIKAVSPVNDLFLVNQQPGGAQVRYGSRVIDTPNRKSLAYLYVVKNNKNTDSIIFNRNTSVDFPIPAVNGNDFYSFYAARRMFFKISNIHTEPLRFTVDSVSVPETFFFYGFTGKWVAVFSYTGKVYVYDTKTLQLQFILAGNYLATSFFMDSNHNLWVPTVDKGLLLYKNTGISRIKIPAGFTSTDFLSVTCDPNGKVLAGNFTGQVIEAANGKTIVHTVAHHDSLLNRQRKIIISHNKIFTFSENGIFVNYKRVITEGNIFVFGKTAAQLNDSIIIVGLSSSLRELNTITEKTAVLANRNVRVTAITAAANNVVYWGSTDGLYCYNYNINKYWHLRGSSLFSERVTGLCISPDSVLWVATAGNGIVGLRHDSVAFHITTLAGLIANDTRCVATGRPGQLWVGTSSGVSIIKYALNGYGIQYSIQNISVNDGLTNNVVNEMTYHNDTVYAATADGVSVIPAGISLPQFNIPVQLVRMSINQRDTIIASSYSLPYNQRNIQMQLAGIELGGHLKNLQYTVDKNSNWVTLDQNILALQLNSGSHTVQVRAIDVNGNISNKILSIEFNIATPFWKTVWFWILAAVLLQLLTLYYLNRWLKKRREMKLAGEIAVIQTAALEQQAFTSLINPHFIFNALNSIQHYINLQDRKNANRYLSDFASLIRKNFEASQKSFITLEEELENIKIYMRLEQMRFSGRFTYRVDIDENADIDEWMIPTMMLQPFLENALLHGIMPSAIEGEIVVDIKEKNGFLQIIITDNGIGIANSKALKGLGGHNSLGMELIEKRIYALSRVSENGIKIHLSEATAGNKNPGTKITLLIYAGLYDAWLQAQKQ
ncbi:MAG TPA: histidine kinase [Chitinophagaceae bacterium]|nr:histidine kinase [Chitinophagaceae bacterium]